MSAAYQQIEQQEAAFSQARAKFSALERHMGSADSMQMTHGQLETYVIEQTHDIARAIIQAHMDLRGVAEQSARVVGADKVERGGRRSSTRKLRLLVGDVVVSRLLYQAAGVEGLAPQDGALLLARDSFSMGVRRRVAEEALRGSFEQVVASSARRRSGSALRRSPNGRWRLLRVMKELTALYPKPRRDEAGKLVHDPLVFPTRTGERAG